MSTNAEPERSPRRRIAVVAAGLVGIVAVALALLMALRVPPAPLPSAPIAPKTSKAKTVRQPVAPVSEGGLLLVHDDVVADEEPPPEGHEELLEATTELCAQFVAKFTLGTPSRDQCSKRTPDALAEARETCRATIDEEFAPALIASIESGRTKPDIKLLRLCADSDELEACVKASFVGQLPRGASCEDDLECVAPTVCAAPDLYRQEFVCSAPAERGAACALGLRVCESGLSCTAGTCTPPRKPTSLGKACGQDNADCAAGLLCIDDVCRRPRGLHESCEEDESFFGTKNSNCASGLACLQGRCVVPVEHGAGCDVVSVCATDCDVCRTLDPGEPPVCAPRGTEDESCASDDDCLTGLVCTAAVCTAIPPLPGKGEACRAASACPDGDGCPVCADDHSCVRGTCRSREDGEICDTSEDCVHRCTNGLCGPWPASGECDEDRCADGADCVAGMCRSKVPLGARCSATDGVSCAGDLVCIDGACLPKRWGGEVCRSNPECQSDVCAERLCQAAPTRF